MGLSSPNSLFEYGIGVATLNMYAVKRIDSDFFENEVPALSDEGGGQAES
jgi:hypothetical protein